MSMIEAGQNDPLLLSYQARTIFSSQGRRWSFAVIAFMRHERRSNGDFERRERVDSECNER